jgi:spore coat protein JC
MFIYEKKLEIPVNIKKKNLPAAKIVITQFGGPDGELSASIRYLSQRFTAPTGKVKALLTDIGTEELGHVEIINTIIYQATFGATPEEFKAAGLGGYYSQHANAQYPADPEGVPWTAAYIQSMTDPVAMLHEDLAAEQKARATYEHLISMIDDPEILRPLRFLWEREVVHYQRFGEALVDVYQLLDEKKTF